MRERARERERERQRERKMIKPPTTKGFIPTPFNEAALVREGKEERKSINWR